MNLKNPPPSSPEELDMTYQKEKLVLDQSDRSNNDGNGGSNRNIFPEVVQNIPVVGLNNQGENDEDASDNTNSDKTIERIQNERSSTATTFDNNDENVKQK